MLEIRFQGITVDKIHDEILIDTILCEFDYAFDEEMIDFDCPSEKSRYDDVKLAYELSQGISDFYDIDEEGDIL